MYAVMKDGNCYCGQEDLFKDQTGFITDIHYDKCTRCESCVPEEEKARLGSCSVSPGPG